MSMKFKFYRYVVNQTAQGLLFSDKEKSKKELILKALKNDRLKNFSSRKSVLGLAVVKEDGNSLYCRFGKQASATRSRPATENFQEEKLENWPHCNMFIDMSEHPDGQKIAIEHNTGVFSDELNPLRSLSDQVNELLVNQGLEMAINPITKEPSFWSIVDKNVNDVQEVSFKYRVPNLFKLGNELEGELKDVQSEYGANEASLTFKNKEGGLKLPKTEKLISESLEYVTKGGGEYTLKIKGKKYTSKDNVASKTIDVELDTNDPQTVKEIIWRLFE